MGAVRIRDQTSDKNITSNVHDSSPSIDVFRSERAACLYEEKKIHQDVLTSNIARGLNSPFIHNIAFSSEKVILSESRGKYARQAPFTRENHSKHMLVEFDVRGQKGMDFFSQEWKNCFENLMGTIYQAESGYKKKSPRIDFYYFTCTFDHQQKHMLFNIFRNLIYFKKSIMLMK